MSVAAGATTHACDDILSDVAMPVLFVSHGGGPGFVLRNSMFAGADADSEAVRFLAESLPASFPRPKAIVIFSAHWETDQLVSVITGPVKPGLFYDYYGFPVEAYAPHLTYNASVSAPVAARVLELLAQAGIPARPETKRGFDHGVFIPLKVLYPGADVPVVQVSLLSSLDAAAHWALGAALEPLRREGVLIVGSGSATHNMRLPRSGGPDAPMLAFVDEVQRALALPTAAARKAALLSWAGFTGARHAHPREEHFLPLVVCAGAGAGLRMLDAGAGAQVWSSWIFGSFALQHYVF